MQSFLEQSAVALWQRYGEEISTLKLVFPSKRARLFFGEALSKLINRPIWQPEYLAIDDFVWGLSKFQQADNLRLIAELYKVYSRYHAEPFDKFYGWGLMLLQDFDSIDKYMVDARGLFRNISDLREIESQFADDSPELEIVREFWRSFAHGKVQSHEQQEFLRIWKSLADIYTEFKARLSELSIAYAGMAYRAVAEHINELYVEHHTYCFLGFNALNECEQKIFKALNERGDALFLWDYSSLYVDDKNQEAGRFIRRNIGKFPQSFSLDNSYNKNLQIEVVSSPTDILQCKALTLKLEDICRRQGYIDKETAIVLTDENLLNSVLSSIPDCVDRLNITMGYPVVNTLIYNLLERLLQLQARRRDSYFYHKDVVGILTHPYVDELNPAIAKRLTDKIQSDQKIYIDIKELHEYNVIFSANNDVVGLHSYLLKVLSAVSATDDAERREYTFSLISTIARLGSTIENCGIELSVSIYISLLRQMLRQIRIPYTGEPLGGVQVMGILETRNVDFKNVIMLSVNDDNFPGNRVGQSYIPYNLRQAYGLPTSTDAEAMYAYYFYRLISRADNLTMLYTSAADDKSTGEQSRYIYQLEYESDFRVSRSDISLSIQQPPIADIVVTKTPAIIEKLAVKRYAPSAINRYIACPVRFYFNDIERIKPAESVDEEFSKLNLGNTLHRAMELLYKPFVGMANPQKYIERISDSDIDGVIDIALNEVAAEQSGAQVELGRDIVRRYVKQNIAYDSRRTDTYIIDKLECKSDVEIWGYNFTGSADRVDRLADGSIAIIDYKSGQGDSLDFQSIESLFDADKTNKAALQTLIYATMFSHSERVDVQPQLYISRKMRAENFSPLLNMKGEKISKISSDFKAEFEAKLVDLMEQINDENVPFTQNPSERRCGYCDYKSICRK